MTVLFHRLDPTNRTQRPFTAPNPDGFYQAQQAVAPIVCDTEHQFWTNKQCECLPIEPRSDILNWMEAIKTGGAWQDIDTPFSQRINPHRAHGTCRVRFRTNRFRPDYPTGPDPKITTRVVYTCICVCRLVFHILNSISLYMVQAALETVVVGPRPNSGI